MKKIIFLFVLLCFFHGLFFAARAEDKNSWIADDVDFTSYMKKLQKEIYSNWHPFKSNTGNNVILFFKIGKDGRLLTLAILKSSGLEEADDAALAAVNNAAPFRPLPKEFKGESIDIEFDFDYNVLGTAKVNKNKKINSQSNLSVDKLYYKQKPVRYDF